MGVLNLEAEGVTARPCKEKEHERIDDGFTSVG